MRAAPAIQVLLRQLGAWQAAIGSLLLVAELCLGGWLIGREAQDVRHQVGVLIAALALLPLAWSLARTRAVQLGWDGQGWTVQSVPLAAGVAPTAGDIAVAVDLGLWMLLRFRPHTRSRWSLPQWLPVQRRGVEAKWHGLRCAVFSPRPRAVADKVQG